MNGNSDFQSTLIVRQSGFEPTQTLSRREVLSGTDRHRQHGEGTIVEKKKWDWIWWVLSPVILGGAVFSPYWFPSFKAWVGW